MSRLRVMLLVCGVFAAVPAFGASPDPEDLTVPPEELSKARELVRRLGNEGYREREEAQAELAKMGRAARQALLEGATADADPEIRSRSTRLLPKAEADDLKARIDTFLEDKEGKFDHDLPGLKTFRKSLGATPKARELYVEILKSPYNLEMFAAMDRGDVEGGRAASDRRNMLWTDMMQRNNFPGGAPGGRQPKQPTLADIAAVLFAESEIPHEFIPRTTIQWQQVSGVLLFQQGVSQQAINGTGAHADAYKLIVGRWLANRHDPMDLAQLVHQLSNLRQFPEAAPLLRRTALMAGGVNVGYAKGQALNLLVQQRGKEETGFLKAIIRNEVRVGDYPDVFKKGENPDKVVSANAEEMVTQVWFQRNLNGGVAEMHSVSMRDVAFAYLLTQSGQNMKDYGFETQPNQNFTPQPSGFGQYAFTTEEKRQAGFVKYGWYQMKQNLKDPAPRAGELPRGLIPPAANTPPAPTPPNGLPVAPGFNPRR